MHEGQKFRTEIGNSVPGLFGAQKQSCCLVRIFTEEPEAFFADDAVLFLKTVLQIIDAPKLEVEENLKSQIGQPVLSVISIASEIARHTLIQGSFPSFDTPRLTRFTKHHTDETLITVDVPTERYHNQEAIRLGYELGLKIAWCFTQPADRRAEVARLVDEDLSALIKLITKVSFGGRSTRFILKEAFDRGLPILHRGSGIYQVGYGHKQRIFQRSATSNDSAVGAKLTMDKWTCLQHLKLSGIPVPMSFRVNDAAGAKAVAKQLGYPVVVKPADRDRGEGVTLDIETANDVDAAFGTAQGFSKNVLVENRVPGICHRLLIFQDRLIFAYARFPLLITGDGEKTIARIIEETQEIQHQRAKHLRKKFAGLSPDTLALLQSQNFNADTVLAEGQTAYLRRYQSPEWGGQDLVNTDLVHPENVELARRAARQFGLETAGIDLITEDVSRPWYDTGAVINEVNFRPQVGANTAREMINICFPENDAEIPIICFIGDKAAMQAGLAELARLRATSEKPFLTSHNMTVGPDLAEIRLHGFNGLFERISYLLKEPRADAVVVVVQTDELLQTGRPFHHASQVTVVNTNLKAKTAYGKMRDSFLVSRLKDLISNTGK